MLVPITRTGPPYQGGMLVDPEDKYTESIVNYWKTQTGSTTPSTYAQVENPLLRTPSSGNNLERKIPRNALDIYRQGAQEGATLAVNYAHPNFPIRSVPQRKDVSWWLRILLIDHLSAPERQALIIARETAETILEVRTFFQAPEMIADAITVEAFASDQWRLNTNLVSIWIPIAADLNAPMAEPCLSRLNPSLLMQVIRHFVQERLRIKGGVEYEHITLATNSIGLQCRPVESRLAQQERGVRDSFFIPLAAAAAQSSTPAGYASRAADMGRSARIIDYTKKCLPDVTLDRPFTKNDPIPIAPRRRQEEEEEAGRGRGRGPSAHQVPSMPLSAATIKFANHLRSTGREVPAWARADRHSSSHMTVLPRPETYVTPTTNTAGVDDHDIMKLLGF